MKKYVRIRRFKFFKKVNYYTFAFETDSPEDEISETDKFFSFFENDEDHEEDLDNLVDWISEIGNNRSARPNYFRNEQGAEALPPPARECRFYEKEVGALRLYCIRINQNIVILANGGIKTAQKVQDCPDLFPKFRFANTMNDQINNLILNRDLVINGKILEGIEDVELEF